jgi:hypothetical protein
MASGYAASAFKAAGTFGEGLQPQIGVQQLLLPLGRALQAQGPAGKGETYSGNFPEILIVPHETEEPGILQLLGAPDPADLLTSPRKDFL